MAKHANNRSFPTAVALFTWRLLTGIRIAVFNIIFFLLLIVFLIAIFTPDQEPIPQKAPLLITLNGNLVDQYSYLSPTDKLLNPNSDGQREIQVRELIHAIDYAASDSRITGLLLELDQYQDSGLSKMLEVGAAIDRFKNSGKPVLAMADNFDQQQYFLASFADEIYLHTMGNVVITGFGMYRNYYKSALDKLAIEFHIFKVGQFKDFVEPFIRNSMSENSRKHNGQWLNELWQVYTQHVEERRDLSSGALTQWVNHMADQLAQHQGNIAVMAQEMHLVDHVMSRVERRQDLIKRFGHKPKQDGELEYVSYQRYNKDVTQHERVAQNANIALVVAKGTILDGAQPEGAIGGDSLSQVLRNVGKDENIKALVLRIDSGGGSAFASEVIRQELQALHDQGMTIVVSMGSVAASGGYWIAMAADEIWATPTTITGSIGVFGLFPTIDKSLSKLGISTDGVGTTDLAGALRIDRPLSSDAANVLQQGVEHIYDEFIRLVAENRRSTPQKIDEIAQGRVWSGIRAKELGLVDQLGYLEDAITSAATRVGIENYKVKLFERELSPQEIIIKELMQEAALPTTLSSILKDWSGMDLTSLNIFLDAAKQAQKGDFNAPRSTYAVCLGCFVP